MIKTAFKKQTEKKFIWMNIGFFTFFLVLYTIIDSLNMPYREMTNTYGMFLTISNIFMNVIMAALSTLMMTLTAAQFKLTGSESKANNVTFASIIVGILTYGCTPCVISFFAGIGISLSAAAAYPLGGFPFKFLSLALLLAGFAWILVRLNKAVCKVDYDKQDSKDLILK